MLAAAVLDTSMLVSFKSSILIRGVGRPSTAAAVRGVGHNALNVVASGSSPRRTSVHPVLAVVAVLAGMAAMVGGLMVTAPRGLRTALATGELCLIAPGLLIVALSGVPVAEGLGLRRVSGRTVLLAALGGATLWAASLGLMNLQFVVWRPPDEFLESFRILHLKLRPRTFEQAVLSVTAIALMPALCEETLFRGIVLPSLARLGSAVALLGSTGLFALIHIDTVSAGPVFYRLPFAFAVGLGLAAFRLLTGSLLPAMIAHAVLNTITFATVFLSGAASEAMEQPQALPGLLLLLGGGAATAWIFRALRR
jgi:membrane protease YdiL (CAAX protease family)